MKLKSQFSEEKKNTAQQIAVRNNFQLLSNNFPLLLSAVCSIVEELTLEVPSTSVSVFQNF